MNCTPPLILRELYTIPKYRKTKPLTSVRRIDLGTTNISKCLSRILTPKVANTIAHTETSRDFVRGIIPKAYEIIVLLFIFPHRQKAFHEQVTPTYSTGCFGQCDQTLEKGQ